MIETLQDDVRQFVVGFLATKSQGDGPAPGDLADDCDLLLSGLLDSLGLLELMMAIQNQWEADIDFDQIDAEEMTILGPVCRFVAEQLAGRTDPR
jgi:acyl carrier protein